MGGNYSHKADTTNTAQLSALDLRDYKQKVAYAHV